MLKEVILSIELVMFIMITLLHSNTATQPHSNAAKQQDTKNPPPQSWTTKAAKTGARAAGPPKPKAKAAKQKPKTRTKHSPPQSWTKTWVKLLRGM